MPAASPRRSRIGTAELASAARLASDVTASPPRTLPIASPLPRNPASRRHARVATGRGLVLGGAARGVFMAYLDATVVNLAFPALAESFPSVGRSTLLWILDAYFIVFPALVPAGAEE